MVLWLLKLQQHIECFNAGNFISMGTHIVGVLLNVSVLSGATCRGP